MDLPMTLDHHLILNGQPKEIAHHLRDALNQSSSGEINTWLLEAVHSESLPPSVFGVWLRMAEPESVAVAFHQAFSSVVQASAIHQFCKLLSCKGRDPVEIWNIFGGTQELLAALAGFSVLHVKLFCKTLGGTGVKQTTREERQPLVTELFKGLTDQYRFSVPFKSSDPRPLLDHYLQLLPACDDEMAVAWRDASTADRDKLQSAHMSAFELQIMDSINSTTDDALSWYSPLLLKFEGSIKVAIQTLHWLNMVDLDPSSKIHSSFFRKLALPLLQKLSRRRLPISLFTEVSDSILRFFERNPASTHGLSLEFLHPIVNRWSRYEAELTPRVEAYLTGPASNIKIASNLEPVLPLIRAVGISKRYRLLRLILRSLAQFRFDVDTMEGKDCPRFPVNLFLELPREQGRTLFAKFDSVEVPAWKYRAQFSPAVAREGKSLLSVTTNECILITELLLLRGEEMTTACSVIEKRQKQAIEAREADDRARYAMETATLAIAAGSPEILEEVIIWCRRFNRDREVVEGLYSDDHEIFNAKECLDLLCGVREREDASLEAIREGVAKGNRLCHLLLETATMVLSEPSFRVSDWDAVRKLFSRVVELRLVRTARLASRQQISSNQLYDAVWTDTISSCLELERIGLKADHDRLNLHFARGPLAFYDGSRLSDLDPSSLKFVDELSKQRDELWQQYRSTQDPPSTSLNAPFPRGLPAQHLFPLLADPARKDGGFEIPPYLFNRIQRVVFMDSTIALQRSPPVDAIGPFIDDWSSLLKVYIASLRLEARKAEIHRVWVYATTKLSSGRMSNELNLIYWSEAFKKATFDVRKLLNVDIPRQESGPTIPAGRPTSSTGWDPSEKASREVWEHELPLENIDLMLDVPSDEFMTKNSYFSVQEKLKVKNVRGGLFHFLPIRSPGKTQERPPEQEGLIAAALLLLGKRGQGTSNGFGEPFPTSPQRFPALHLTNPFVKEYTRQEDFAVKGLRHYTKLKRTPSSLLAWLVKGLFASLEQNESPGNLGQILFPVIQVLSQSDKTYLALEVVGHVVTARPGESSWHRYIMTKRFLSRLSARQAADFVAGIATAVQGKLSQRSKGKRDESPAIKISTIKLIVDLICNSKVVSQAFAVNALVGILDSSRHIDVRVAVVKAWIDQLVYTIPPPLTQPTQTQEEIREQILSALEAQAIPVAASLNERTPKADGLLDRGELPEVYRESNMTGIPPVLDALLNAVRLFEADSGLQTTFVTRILAPTLRKSSAVNRRFLEMFATKHQLGVPISPPIPVKPLSLTCLMTDNLELTPSDLLDIWANHVRFHLTTDDGSRGALDLLGLDSSVADTVQGQHWLQIQGFSARRLANVTFGGVNLGRCLADGFETRLSGDGITSSQILTIFYQLADIVIQKDVPGADRWESLTGSLAPPMTANTETTAKWQKNARPIVEELVKKVVTIRSSTNWQQNPSRNPLVLPDTFRLRLWLLPFPHMPWPLERDLGGEVKGLLREMTDSNRPYASSFKQLEDTLRSMPRDSLVQVALSLGVMGDDVSSGRSVPSLVEHLCAELASSLLRGRAVWPDDEVMKQEAQSMIKGWLSSADEELRRKGLILRQSL